MLSYYLFWMFMGFIKHFYTTFGTNLLTQSPVPVPVFPCFKFRRKGISNGVQTEWNFRDDFSWTKRHPGDLECKSEEPRGDHKGGGCAPTLMTTSWLSWRRVQVSWILSDEKITFPKFSFRLDSVWYSVSPKHWNRQKNLGWASG